MVWHQARFKLQSIVNLTERNSTQGSSLIREIGARAACISIKPLRQSGSARQVIVCVFQDVMGLVRNLCLVLTNEQVRLQLQLNARQTAEQFKPVAIAERCVTAVSGVG